MTRSIDYGTLMHRAMRGLIHEVLSDVRDHGLPGAAPGPALRTSRAPGWTERLRALARLPTRLGPPRIVGAGADALRLQAALLIRDAPAPVSDAFRGRLAGALTYGARFPISHVKVVVERARLT